MCMICQNATELCQEYVKLTRQVHAKSKSSSSSVKNEETIGQCGKDTCVADSKMRGRCNTAFPMNRDECAQWCLCPDANQAKAAYANNMIPPCLRFTEDFKEIHKTRSFDILDFPIEGKKYIQYFLCLFVCISCFFYSTFLIACRGSKPSTALWEMWPFP